MALSAGLSAQNPPAPEDPNAQVRVVQEAIQAGQRAAREAAERDQRSIVPLKVQVVLSKFKDGKLLSSLPYELTLASDNQSSSVRMGAKVPVVNASDPAGGVTYQEAGTNIDGRVRPLDSGRFAVWLAIEDTSVIPGEVRTARQGPEGTPLARLEGPPSFRTYRSANSVILRDGQSTQFTAASDKVTGEELRAQVTLTVVK
ncbi:MAG: hypothetical protein AB7K63_11415 [Vicinamibacterales bacterium]